MEKTNTKLDFLYFVTCALKIWVLHAMKVRKMSIFGLKILFLLRINWLKQHIYTMKFVLPKYIVMMLIVLGIYNFGPGLRAPYCEYMCTDQLAQCTLKVLIDFCPV